MLSYLVGRPVVYRYLTEKAVKWSEQVKFLEMLKFMMYSGIAWKTRGSRAHISSYKERILTPFWHCVVTFFGWKPVAVCLIAILNLKMLLWLEHWNFLLQYLVTLVSASVNHQMKRKLLQYKIIVWLVFVLMSLALILWNVFKQLWFFFFCKYEAQLTTVLCSRCLNHIKIFLTCSSLGKMWSCVLHNWPY